MGLLGGDVVAAVGLASAVGLQKGYYGAGERYRVGCAAGPRLLWGRCGAATGLDVPWGCGRSGVLWGLRCGGRWGGLGVGMGERCGRGRGAVPPLLSRQLPLPHVELESSVQLQPEPRYRNVGRDRLEVGGALGGGTH